MDKVKKIIIYIAVFIFISSNIFFSYTYADSDNQCSSCRATPVWMQMYINFEVELLWVLQWASAQPETVWKNKKSGLFAGWSLSLSSAFLQSTLSKAKKDFESETKAARSLAISSVLLYKMSLSHMWKDGVWSLSILFQDESFVRDYKILQEIDMSANDIIRDMWVNWIWNKSVSAPIQTKVIWLQTEYSDFYWWSDKIFEKLIISSNVKYRTLLTFVLELNSLMKTTLYSVGNNDRLKKNIKKFENKYSKWDIIVKLDADRVESIIVDYECAKNGDCNKNLIEAFSWLLNIDLRANSFSNTKKTITDADKKLVEAFWSWWSYDGFGWRLVKRQKTGSVWGLTDRQIELLYNVYWVDAYELTNSQLDTLKRNRQQIKKEFNPFYWVINSSKNSKWKDLKWNQDQSSKTNNKWETQEKKYKENLTDQEKQTLISDLLWQKNVWESEIGQLLISDMQETVNSILSEKTNDKWIVLVWVNNDTHFFVKIWSYIHSIVEKEIWDKNSNWLVDNLWKICVYQCSNKWNKNCYDK